jgi:predicted HAD superfamily Cof-like phosphohydrolase
MSTDWVADLIEWENAVEARYRATPGPFKAKERLRIKLLAEEYRETIEAILKLHATAAMADGPTPLPYHLGAVADGLADLIYVAIGTAVNFGIDLRPVWDAVHAANLAKVAGGVIRRADGKTMKPPGWKHPDIAEIVAAQPPLPGGTDPEWEWPAREDDGDDEPAGGFGPILIGMEDESA